jgi:hypothetical protein
MDYSYHEEREGHEAISSHSPGSWWFEKSLIGVGAVFDFSQSREVDIRSPGFTPFEAP